MGLHDFVVSREDARDFVGNLTDAFSDEELIAKRTSMIEEVSSRVSSADVDEYERKLRGLFGSLVDGFLSDPVLAKHRAEHGGIDIF